MTPHPSSTALHPLIRAKWLVLAAFVAVCLWLLPGTQRTRHDDDVLAFLPPDHPDVVGFREVAQRFGMLEVVLVGLEPSSGRVVDLEHIDRIRALTKRVDELPGVRLVLSFVDLPDPKIVGDGLVVDPLVPEALRDPAAIESRVLGSRDAVGTLVSADGRAANLLVFLLDAPPEVRAEQRKSTLVSLREVVAAGWEGQAYFGGGPAFEQAAADNSRHDIERLSPIVIGVLAVTSALLLRSITAALLNLLMAGLGVGLVIGAHGTFGEPLTIVSSTIPVMMVALGGAFGVHMIAGYQRQPGAPGERASAALRELWRPVVLSGVTTAVAFFALMMMPQVPMQRFGVVAGVGVLLLLGLALLVLPAVLGALPAGVLRTRPEPAMPLRARPPALVLVALAVIGTGLATGLRADPDTAGTFAPNSEPRRADTFFQQHFGGSTYLQIAVETDLSEPTALRAIEDMAQQIRGVDGVVDVRTLVEPVAIVTAALGGRRGVPETQPRARRVLTYIADHPAMAQLMTTDGQGALMHVKLRPLDGVSQVAATEQIRAIVARATGVPAGAEPAEGVAAPRLVVASTAAPAVAEQRAADVRARLARALGRDVPDAVTASAAARAGTPALLEAVTAVRDRALDSDDSPVSGIPRAEITAITPQELLSPRGAALEGLLRKRLPTLVATDPEGIRFAADHLGAWLDEAIQAADVAARCELLGLKPPVPPTDAAGDAAGMDDPFAAPTEGAPATAAVVDATRAAIDDPTRCDRVVPILAELGDLEWRAPEGAATEPLRELPFAARVTGQPVVGQAFARSVESSLVQSTLVSVAALAAVLALAGQLIALVPALWTLAVTCGAIAALGHPISIGTSMVTCIALGAGVDFAIHLGVRARELAPHTPPGASPGDRAVHEIGAVILISGVQLGAAFAVLLASSMPPLQQFSAGLSLGLVVASLGAVWLTPWLIRAAHRSPASAHRR